MKRDEHVNDMPDIEIIDLENETVQDTDFGKSDISDDFEGSCHQIQGTVRSHQSMPLRLCL